MFTREVIICEVWPSWLHGPTNLWPLSPHRMVRPPLGFLVQVNQTNQGELPNQGALPLTVISQGYRARVKFLGPFGTLYYSRRIRWGKRSSELWIANLDPYTHWRVKGYPSRWRLEKKESIWDWRVERWDIILRLSENIRLIWKCWWPRKHL